MTLYKVGDAYPDSANKVGTVFYVYNFPDPTGHPNEGLHGLVAATVDQSSGSGIQWSSTGIPTYTEAIFGTDESSEKQWPGSGKMNTARILAILGLPASSSSNYYAAKLCSDYSVTAANKITYIDWYLPSKWELNEMYKERVVIGNFTTDYYWSSSEYFSVSAWAQHLSSGFQATSVKYDTFKVRCVRAF
jgi:hypothetical protein